MESSAGYEKRFLIPLVACVPLGAEIPLSQTLTPSRPTPTSKPATFLPAAHPQPLVLTASDPPGKSHCLHAHRTSASTRGHRVPGEGSVTHLSGRPSARTSCWGTGCGRRGRTACTGGSPRPWPGRTCGSRRSSASNAWSGSGWGSGRRSLVGRLFVSSTPRSGGRWGD